MQVGSYWRWSWLFFVVVVGLILWVGGTAKGAGPHRYTPKHGHHCRKHYRAFHHGKKTFCVKRGNPKKAPASPAPLARPVKLHSHLDPTSTRDPLNPFRVTYAYSASATQEEAQPQAAFAFAAAQEPAPLPSGVLALFSDGKLECAINVGGVATGSECPVSYAALGQHTVTTIYSSGELSATETEVEQIDPLATTTSLQVTYEDVEGGPRLTRANARCENFTPNERRCTYDYAWWLGTITATGASSLPGSTPTLTCIEGLECEVGFGGKTLDAEGISALVMLKAHAFIRSSGPEQPSCEELHEIVDNPNTLEGKWTYPTSIGLRATTTAAGYLTSTAEATTPFTPALPC